MAPTDPAWRELTRTGLGRTSYHCPELVASANEAFGLRSVGWGAMQHNELVGGIVLQFPPNGHPRPRGTVLYNGPIVRPSSSSYRSVRDRHASRVVAALMGQVAETAPASQIRIRTEISDIRIPLESGWSAKPRFSYEVSIAPLDQAWEAMDRNRRRLIRRAEQHGYRVDKVDRLNSGSDSMVEHLIRLQKMHDEQYGPSTPADSSQWDRLLTPLLASGAARLFVAFSPRGEPVGFHATVVSGDLAGTLLTGADPSHGPAGANSLLRWSVMQALNADGVVRMDLNGARTGPTGRFKASLGAELTELWYLYRPESHRPPNLARRIAGRVRRKTRRNLSGLRATAAG